MSTYTRPITAQFLASGLAGTLGYAVHKPDGSTWIDRTTAGIAELGSSGIYTASVAGWDTSWTGRVVWDDGAGSYAAEDFLDATLTGDVLDQSETASLLDDRVAAALGATPVTLPATPPAGYAAPNPAAISGVVTPAVLAGLATTPVKLDLTQSLANTKAGTTGGALHGAWVATWGKVVANSANRILSVFGIGGNATPIATFQLDNVVTPLSRDPL